MATKAQAPKRQPKIKTLFERVHLLAGAWEHEQDRLTTFLTPEKEADANHPSGKNRAYYFFQGQVGALAGEHGALRGLTEEADDDKRLTAFLQDEIAHLTARALDAETYLEDNAEQLASEWGVRWILEGKARKLRQMKDAVEDVLKAHAEGRK